MLYEVPPISKARKEVFMFLKNELGSRKVWIYPITDTLVLAFSEPPKAEQLAFGKMVKKKMDSDFLALNLCDDSLCAVVKKGDRVEKFVVPFNKDALLSILNTGKNLDVFIVANKENEELIRMLREVAHLVSFTPKIKQVKVGVGEDDLKEVLTEKELKEIFRENWEKVKENKFFRTGVVVVALGGILFLGFEGIGYYLKRYRETHTPKTVKTRVMIPYYYYGLSAYNRLESIEKNSQAKLLAFSYNTDSRKLTYITEGNPHLSDFPRLRFSSYSIFEVVISDNEAGTQNLKVAVGKEKKVKPLSLKEAFGLYNGQGSLESFFFYVPNITALEKVFTLRGCDITGIKESGRWLVELQKIKSQKRQRQYRKRPQGKIRKI